VISRRRFFVTGAAGLAAPLVVEAQQANKVPRIGRLEQGSARAETDGAFRQGLRDLGYVEGQSIVLEYRAAEGRAERLPDLAAELVSLKVDVIVAGGTLAPLAAKHATRTIPIVLAAAGDPVGTGLVTNLGRPGVSARMFLGR
jgi:putative ABC transport system substrate-binding protein